MAFSRRSFLTALAGTASASVLAACGGGGGTTTTAPSGGQTPAPATTTGAAATPAGAAKPAAGTPVLVWQTLDYIPSTTQGVHDRFDGISKDKGLTLQFEELPNNSTSDDRFNAAVQAGAT
jgi:hypothetical protein